MAVRNLTEMREKIERIIKDTNNVYVGDADINDAINEALLIWAAEVTQKKATATTQLVASQRDYTLPADCLKVHSVTFQGKPLQEISLRELDIITGGDRDEDDTDAWPRYYYFMETAWPSVIYIYQAYNASDSGATRSLRVFYYVAPAVLSGTDSPDIQVRFQPAIEAYATSVALSVIDRHEAAALWMAKFSRILNLAKGTGDIGGPWRTKPYHSMRRRGFGVI